MSRDVVVPRYSSHAAQCRGKGAIVAYTINKDYDSRQTIEGADRIQKSDGYFWFSDDRMNRFVISADLVYTIEWADES